MKENNEHIKEKEIIHEKVEINGCMTAPHPEMARNTEEDEPCEESK